MVDSSWDNGGGAGPERSAAFPVWMKVALVLGVMAAMLVAIGVGTAQRRSRELWPVVAQVVRELSTEEGSRSFLGQHPETLKEGESEEEFLQRLRAWRGAFGQPMKGAAGPNGFRAMARPLGWRAVLKGQGEAWLGVQAVGTRLQVFPVEGRSERARMAANMGRAWKRALADLPLEVARLLQSEEGARRLYQQNPGLAEGFRSEEAFLAEAARLRPALKGLPLSSGELPQERLSTRIQGTPFGFRVELRLRLEGGQTLRMLWKQDRLGSLELE